MAENVLNKLNQRKKEKTTDSAGTPAPFTRAYWTTAGLRFDKQGDFISQGANAEGDTGDEAIKQGRRRDWITLWILVFLFCLTVAAIFSPLGCYVFPCPQATGGGGGGEGADIPCDGAAGCDSFAVMSLETDELTCGLNDPSRPANFYNEQVTIHDGATMTFAPGSAVVCPTDGFLNNCVDGGTSFTPTCNADYAGCDAATPFAVGTAAVADELVIGAAATLTLEAGSTLTCPTADFLNDCVTLTETPPACTDYTTCTDFVLAGAEVRDGVLSLTLGSDILTSTGTVINIVSGASTVYQSGAVLSFQAGSSVVCPDPSFLNDCVDEFYTPTCLEHAGCTDLLVQGLDVNGGTLDLLAGADLTTTTGSVVRVANGANLQFDAGSSVTCPDPGYLNNCVDELFTPHCATNFDQCGSTDPFVVGQLQATEGIELTNGSVVLNSGASLEFGAGSSLTCPSPGFLNACVDESFTPTCATNYDQCGTADPLVVGALSLTEGLTMETGATLAFQAGSSVTCPTTGFLNGCVDEPFTPTCATNYDQCSSGDPLVVGASEITEQQTFASGSTLVFSLGSQVQCPDPGFLNDCVDESGTNVPSCSEHATCTNFTVAGLSVSGGSLDLLSGSGLTTSTGTLINVTNGAQLVFETGASVVCPDPAFLNDCVEEFYTPTCEEHAACTNLQVVGLDLDGGVLTLASGADLLATAGSEIQMPNGASQTFASGSLLQFQAGASVTCPSSGFLNACVDEPFTVTCATNYDQCNSGDPFTVGAVVATEQIALPVGSTLSFATGSSVTCPSADFLNDCVDEFYQPTCTEHAACTDLQVIGLNVGGGNLTLAGAAAIEAETGSAVNMQSGSTLNFAAGSAVTCPSSSFLNDCVDEFYTPVCTEHSACPDFEVTGVNVAGGSVDLLSGANITTSLGSTVTMANGASTVYESGAVLEFGLGSSVTCPSPGFFNSCVDEAFTPTCATNYDQCSSIDPLVVGGLSLTEDLTMESGSSLTFATGSSVTCPSPGFFNSCVDEAFTPTCATNYDQCSSIDPLVVGGLSLTEDLTMESGSSLTFATGSSVTCPTTGFLNNCVDEPFTPTCATNYDQCSSLDPLVVGGLSLTEDLTMESGSSLTFATGSSVTCPTTGFLNNCVDEPFTPTCATNYDQCSSIDPLVVGGLSLTEDLTMESGSSLTFATGSSVTCPTAGFLNNCVDEPFTPTCGTNYDQCNSGDPLVAGAIQVTEQLNMAAGADLAMASTSSVTFALGSSVVCPTTDFLNACVDETFTPMCQTNYDQCDSVDPFFVGAVNLTEIMYVQPGSTIELLGTSETLGAKRQFSTDAIVTGGRLNVNANAIVDVSSGGFVTLENGGVMDVQPGGEIQLIGLGSNMEVGPSALVNVQNTGTIRLQNGAVANFLDGAQLQMQGGSDMFVLSSANINMASGSAHIIESGAQIAVQNGGTIDLQPGGNLDVFGGGIVNLFTTNSQLLVGSGAFIDIFSGGRMDIQSGAHLNVESGGRLDVLGGGVIDLTTTNSLLEVSSGAIIDILTGGNMDIESGGALNVRSGGDIIVNGLGAELTLSNGGRVRATSNSGIDISLNAEIEILSGGRLNVLGGGVIDLTTTSSLLEVSSGALIDILTGGNMDIESGGALNVRAGGDIFVTGSGAELTLSSGGRISAAASSGMDIYSTGFINILSGGRMNVFGGGTIDLTSTNSRLEVSNGAAIDVISGGTLTTNSGSTVDFQTGSTVMCGAPIFDIASGCISEHQSKRILFSVFPATIAAGTTSTQLVFDDVDTTVSTLPTSSYVAGMSTYNFAEQGVYSITVHMAPPLADPGTFGDQSWGIQIRRSHRTYATGDGPSSGTNTVFQHICTHTEDRFNQAPGGMCTYTAYFHVGDTLRFYLNSDPQPVNYQIGNLSQYFERLEIIKLAA